MVFCASYCSSGKTDGSPIQLIWKQEKSWQISSKYTISNPSINVYSIYPIITLAIGSCPSGWTLFGDSCYYISLDDSSTWTGAQTSCEQIDADLVSIHGADEQSFLTSKSWLSCVFFLCVLGFYSFYLSVLIFPSFSIILCFDFSIIHTISLCFTGEFLISFGIDIVLRLEAWRKNPFAAPWS